VRQVGYLQIPVVIFAAFELQGGHGNQRNTIHGVGKIPLAMGSCKLTPLRANLHNELASAEIQSLLACLLLDCNGSGLGNLTTTGVRSPDRSAS